MPMQIFHLADVHNFLGPICADCILARVIKIYLLQFVAKKLPVNCVSHRFFDRFGLLGLIS
jgi:hypothetical protein